MNFIVGSCWIYFSMAFWLWAAGSGPALLCSSFWRILRCRHAKINVTIYNYINIYMFVFMCLFTYLCNITYVTMDIYIYILYIYIIYIYILCIACMNIIYMCDCMCKYVCVCNWVRVDKRPTGDSDTLSFPLRDARLGEPQDFNWETF